MLKDTPYITMVTAMYCMMPPYSLHNHGNSNVLYDATLLIT